MVSEKRFFIPAAPPLNPWQIINLAIRISEKNTGKIKVITNLDLLNAVKEWIKDKGDPLAYLMALELILNARSMASEEEKAAFTEGDFYMFLDRLFEALLFEGNEDVPKEIKMVHTIWQMRIHLARYYLKYIDLNARVNIEDEKKVALAWWMSRELGSSLEQFFAHMKVQDRIEWINKNTEEVIKRQEDSIGFTHLFECQEKHMSLGRYCTLEDKFLLTSATLSMLMPRKAQNINENMLFKGIKQPKTALSTEIRDKMITNLLFHTMLGNGPVKKGVINELPLLWNIPL